MEGVPETASAWCLGAKMNGWNKKRHGGGWKIEDDVPFQKYGVIFVGF